jgi:hypothetical protein
MFTQDATIDLIQTAKKTFVNTVFANHEKIATAMNEFVDAQTEYTKKAAKAGSDVAAKLTSETVKIVQDAAKFDYLDIYSKAFETFTKAAKK